MNEINNLNSKVKRVHVIILIFTLIIVISLFRWQAVEASRMSKIAKERSTTSEITSNRGTIYSQDGTTLAFTEPRFDMFLWLKDLDYYEKLGLQTRQEFLKKVAPI